MEVRDAMHLIMEFLYRNRRIYRMNERNFKEAIVPQEISFFPFHWHTTYTIHIWSSKAVRTGSAVNAAVRSRRSMWVKIFVELMGFLIKESVNVSSVSLGRWAPFGALMRRTSSSCLKWNVVPMLPQTSSEHCTHIYIQHTCSSIFYALFPGA